MNTCTAHRLLQFTSIFCLSGIMGCGRANVPSTPAEQAVDDTAEQLAQMLAVFDSAQAEALEPHIKLLAAKYGLDASQVGGLIDVYRRATRPSMRAPLSDEPLPEMVPFDLAGTADQVAIPVPVAADILLWFELLTKRCDAGE